MRRSTRTLAQVATLAALAVAAVSQPAAAAAPAPPAARQVVNGSVATLLEVPINVLPAEVISAHHLEAKAVNGVMIYAFNVDRRTIGGRFALADRHEHGVIGTAQGSNSYGLFFLDKPLGTPGARIIGYVDKHVDGVERGLVPRNARSVYAFATHGLNRTFRYTAVSAR